MVYRCKWAICLRINHTTVPDLVCEYIQQAGETVVWRNRPWRRKRGLEEPEPIKKERAPKEPALKRKRLKWLTILIMVMNSVMKQAFQMKLNYLFTKTLNIHETRIVHSRVTV